MKQVCTLRLVFILQALLEARLIVNGYNVITSKKIQFEPLIKHQQKMINSSKWLHAF
jgi:hypothetical protein